MAFPREPVSALERAQRTHTALGFDFPDVTAGDLLHLCATWRAAWIGPAASPSLPAAALAPTPTLLAHVLEGCRPSPLHWAYRSLLTALTVEAVAAALAVIAAQAAAPPTRQAVAPPPLRLDVPAPVLSFFRPLLDGAQRTVLLILCLFVNGLLCCF